jgi:ribosomal protein L13
MWFLAVLSPGPDKNNFCFLVILFFVDYGTLLKTKPELVVEKAIKGMLPHNKLGADMFRKLKVYRDAAHPHQAQKPEAWVWQTIGKEE